MFLRRKARLSEKRETSNVTARKKPVHFRSFVHAPFFTQLELFPKPLPAVNDWKPNSNSSLSLLIRSTKKKSDSFTEQSTQKLIAVSAPN